VHHLLRLSARNSAKHEKLCSVCWTGSEACPVLECVSRDLLTHGLLLWSWQMHKEKWSKTQRKIYTASEWKVRRRYAVEVLNLWRLPESLFIIHKALMITSVCLYVEVENLYVHWKHPRDLTRYQCWSKFFITEEEAGREKGCYGSIFGAEQVSIISLAFCGIHNPKREPSFYGSHSAGDHLSSMMNIHFQWLKRIWIET